MSRTQTMEQAEFTLVIERVFDAPREQVWKAWTDRDIRMQWLSPKDFSVRQDDGRICAGHEYKACMISSAGKESRYAGEYREVKEPEKLVFTHTWQNDICGVPYIETLCTVLLEETADGKTKMIFTQSGLRSADARRSHNGGWSECFDKLKAVV
ncbi:SRPBCC family protein [Kiloniella litopenaei]|uniref:SRPBCC family protein n=1 Tax=Kiloniella litopenaei TaxID=1549748 RepID=UPI003BA86BCD